MMIVSGEEEGIEAMTSNGYGTPKDTRYTDIVKCIDWRTFSSRSSEREVAMIVAELVEECGGRRVRIKDERRSKKKDSW